jgi:hypothetical protein
MFGFTKKIPTPLTEFCTRLDANLIEAANLVMADGSPKVDKRVNILSLLIMAASGNFVSSLRWDKAGFWEGSRRYLRGTNLDVITAEASVWIAFLMGQCWKNEKDRERLERMIGRLTFHMAARMALGFIRSSTGFDFTEVATERRKLYLQSLKYDPLFESFASVVLRSVGRKSLAEPLSPVSPPPQTAPEWTPISMNVGVFFSTMPLGYYDTFKNMLREAPGHFPYGEELWEAD